MRCGFACTFEVGTRSDSRAHLFFSALPRRGFFSFGLLSAAGFSSRSGASSSSLPEVASLSVPLRF